MSNIISFVGTSNSGKTTLIEKLIPILKGRGYRVGVIKHTSHEISLEKKGKDSWRHKQAGADAVMVASKGCFSMVRDTEEDDLESLSRFMDGLDLIITEGFKKAQALKIEVFRPRENLKPLFLGNKQLVAFVTDGDNIPDVPCFHLDDIAGVADFIENRFLK